MTFSLFELFLLLVAIIGPLKPTVILASAASSSGADPAAVRNVELRTALTTSSILLVFIVLGEFLLNIFKVSIPAFQIGGAIVLLIFALQTIIEDPQKAKQQGEGLYISPSFAIYPLAIPLMASPAVLILIISLVGETDGFAPLLPLIGVIAVIMAVDYIFMRNCIGIARALSPAVTLALGKIVAVLLGGLAVELMFVGLNSWGVVSIEGLKASGK